MTRLFEERVRRLLAADSAKLLAGGRKGLEKESLRVTSNGSISMSPHPHKWGSPLTHPYITTDYSEALSEFITPPYTDVRETVSFLDNVHRFLHQYLPSNEVLWSSSMPCAVSDDSAIPIARYGNSNIGKLKHVYRVGLDYRYGRRMQAIAGVHFNYSLPPDFWPAFQATETDGGGLQDFIDARYFALIRNFRRLGWMIPFLFGNSPAVCESFLGGRTTRFKKLMPGTYYLPYATSLRMSDIGYKNKNQSALLVSHDSLAEYVASLRRALNTPYPEYEAIGLRDGEDYVQLSTSVLQIENEYYSFIRPKRTTQVGERPSAALSNNGVEYVEVRALDVNCLSPTGVDIEQLYFIEAFLIFCLLEDSPSLSVEEMRGIEYNELTVALRGRAPALELVYQRERRPIKNWSLEICERMQVLCESLDAACGGTDYSAALAHQVAAIRAPDSLPSARVLGALRDSGQQFHAFAMQLANDYRAHFLAHPPSDEVRREFEALASRSHEEQKIIEANDKEAFDEYLARYLAV
jgi:glutamate--cysteine ligase